MTAQGPLPAIVDEARRLLGGAREHDVPVRLVGGLAVRLRAGEEVHAGLAREYKDIDLVTPKGRTKPVAAWLTGMGYRPSDRFNAMNGHERMLFHDVANGRQLDVFVGVFRMCHEIPLDGRLLVDRDTIPLAELLLTKLQIVKVNEKDLRDVVALLHHHDVAEHDGDAINAARVAALCAADWGLWRTCRGNVERAREQLDRYPLTPAEQAVVAGRLDRLWERVEREPRSRAWRLRNRIGDRKVWYDDPEEVGG